MAYLIRRCRFFLERKKIYLYHNLFDILNFLYILYDISLLVWVTNKRGSEFFKKQMSVCLCVTPPWKSGNFVHMFSISLFIFKNSLGIKRLARFVLFQQQTLKSVHLFIPKHNLTHTDTTQVQELPAVQIKTQAFIRHIIENFMKLFYLFLWNRKLNR